MLRAFLNNLIDRFQAAFPPNRIAVALMIFMPPISAAISTWVTTNLPGFELSATTIDLLAGAAFVAAFGALYKWLDRWQADERTNDAIYQQQRLREINAEVLADRKEYQLAVAQALKDIEDLAVRKDSAAVGGDAIAAGEGAVGSSE